MTASKHFGVSEVALWFDEGEQESKVCRELIESKNKYMVHSKTGLFGVQKCIEHADTAGHGRVY